MHDTKIGVIVRDDLETWQKLNVTAFLAAGVGANAPGSIGDEYEDGSGNKYLSIFAQPVFVYAASVEHLQRTRTRGVYDHDAGRGAGIQGTQEAQEVIAAMRFDDYMDADGGTHRSISDNPFIVLQADNSNQIRTLRNALLGSGLVFTDFTSTMTEGTYADQRTRTKQTPEAELEYFGICVFGETEQLNVLTKKFSLWR